MIEPDSLSERDRRCILILGMPRSGTTWIGKLFDSHPHTLYRHEPDSWREFSWSRYPDPSEAPRRKQELREFVAALPEIKTLRVVGKTPLFRKNWESALGATFAAAGIHAARAGSRLFSGFPVLLQANGARDAQRRVVWKTIESLGRLGVFLAVLDQARAIHILRHPCGMIASVQRGQAARRFVSAANPSEDYGIFKTAMDTSLGEPYHLSMAYLKSLTPEERMAWRWILINEKAWLEGESNPRYLCVRYEDICADPGAGVARMFDFTGLDLPPQTRAFIKASTSRNRENYYSVFKNPGAAARRWREVIDRQTTDRIMAIVARSRIGKHYSSDTAPEAVDP